MSTKLSLARICTVALLTVASAGTPIFAASKGVDATATVNLSNIRIDNFGQVDATYYRGAQPKAGDYAALAALGVKTIINLTSDDADETEQAMAERAGMIYVQIPMDTHTVPTSAQLDQFMTIVNDPAQQPVYVHCVGGRHRTGVMTAAYRMTQDGWTPEQAFSEMKQYQYGADFLHPEFKAFVYRFPAQMRLASAEAAAAPSTITAR